MQPTLDQEVYSQLVRYLANQLPLTEFRDWFDQNTWEVDQSGNPEAMRLASAIELRLAEFSTGHWTEDELRQQLRPLTEVCEMELRARA
jgi:hypothetical protein